ncbi:MAG: hypothetical protein AAGG75_14055 [Bacteroidota bacterium]
MDKSRLIELLQTFDKKDVRACRKFLQSPLHNQRQDVLDLFEYLVPLIPFTRKRYIEKSYVYEKLYGRGAYDEKKISYMMSFLYQALKRFLAYQEFTAEETVPQIYLSRALRRRGLNRHFESELKQAKAKLREQPYRSVDYHLNHFQICFEESDYMVNQKRAPSTVLQQLFDELNAFYVAQKLSLSCSAFSQEILAQGNYQKGLLPEVLQFVENSDFSATPAIAIYFYSYKMLSTPDSEHYFYQLQGYINAQYHKFPVNELKDIYLFSINYCIRQQNLGKRQFLNEAFKLYQQGLERQVFLVNGMLASKTYNNISLAGIILNEFEWVEGFLFEYKDRLEEKYEGNSFNYNLAYLYYKKTDYNNAMKLLQQVEFEDMLFNLQARRMLLKIYYELEELAALDSLLSSFKNFIYRHNLGYHKDNYLNLLKFTRKLLQLNTFDKTAVGQLRGEIETTPALAERKWLLEQLG